MSGVRNRLARTLRRLGAKVSRRQRNDQPTRGYEPLLHTGPRTPPDTAHRRGGRS